MFLLLASVSLARLGQASLDQSYFDRLGRPVGTLDRPIIYPETRDAGIAGINYADGDSTIESLDVLSVRREWTFSVMGTGIGDTGLQIADIDDDGNNEIISSAGPPNSFSQNTFWYVLGRQPDGTYLHKWVSPIYGAAVSCLRVRDYNGDGKPDVIVASGSTIFVYRGTSKALLASIGTSAATIRGLNLVDVDSDLQKEFVFVDGASLYIYNASTGALEQKLGGYGGYDVAVANVDADPKLEIVVGNDTAPGYVLDGVTRAVEWAYSGGFGAYVRLADLDGDGKAELVGANRWYYITAWDLDIRSPKWQANTSQDIDALQIVDVDKDGSLEVCYGDGQWGSFRVLDGSTGAVKWSIQNTEHGMTDIAVGNLDGDSANEVVFGAGYSSTGPDYLFVFDAVTRAKEWQSLDLVGPFTGLAAGDIDGDGKPEVAHLSYSSDSDYDGSIYTVHSALSKAIEYISAPVTSSRGGRRIAVANVDADPQMEIFVAAPDSYDGSIICIDGLTHTQQFKTSPLYGQTFRSLVVTDVDNDGQQEIVAATAREHTGATGTYVYVFNASTGVQEWRSPISLGSYWAELWYLRVANVDADPNPEIIVGEADGSIWIFDGVTHAMQLASGDLDLSSLDIADLNNDGIGEVIVGSSSGVVTVRDPNTGNQTQVLGSFGGRIDGLRVRNVAGNSSPDLIFCLGGFLNISYKDQVGGEKLWTSSYIGPDAGRYDSIMVGDFERDGRIEIMLSSGIYGVAMYEVTYLGAITPGKL